MSLLTKSLRVAANSLDAGEKKLKEVEAQRKATALVGMQRITNQDALNIIREQRLEDMTSILRRELPKIHAKVRKAAKAGQTITYHDVVIGAGDTDWKTRWLIDALRSEGFIVQAKPRTSGVGGRKIVARLSVAIDHEADDLTPRLDHETYEKLNREIRALLPAPSQPMDAEGEAPSSGLGSY